MPLPGYGISPFGAPETPYGFYAAEDAPDLPTPTVTTASRFLSPSTGDYQISDSTGHQAQISRVLQRALLALRTRRGSATAAPGFGYDWPLKMGRDFEAQVAARVRDALRQLVEVERAASIDSLVVTRGDGGRYSIDLLLRNNETGEAEKIVFDGSMP